MSDAYNPNEPKSFPGIERVFDRWKNAKRVMPDEQRKIYNVLGEVYQGKSFADVGCAVGIGSNILSHRSLSVWAVDVEPELVDFARAMFANPRLSFDIYDILNPPVRPHYAFDVILFLEVIEHLPRDQWDRAMNNLKKFFREGTVGFISTPNRSAPHLGHDHPTNELHTYEAPAGEFYEFLTRHFQHVVLYSVPKLATLGESETIDGSSTETPVLAKVEGVITGVEQQEPILPETK